MVKILEKVERRLGEKLFLKGDRCVGPKCAMIRRGYPPGMHGTARGRGRGRGRNISEYGELLGEKQKVRFFYSLDGRQIRRYVEEAARQDGLFSDNLLQILERRLDVVVWRLGLSPSRRAARQAISHGRIAVNERRVTSPSYPVKKGDVVSMSGLALKGGISQPLSDRLRAVQPPVWLSIDKERVRGTMTGVPNPETVGISFDLTKIKEFYSR